MDLTNWEISATKITARLWNCRKVSKIGSSWALFLGEATSQIVDKFFPIWVTQAHNFVESKKKEERHNHTRPMTTSGSLITLDTTNDTYQSDNELSADGPTGRLQLVQIHVAATLHHTYLHRQTLVHHHNQVQLSSGARWQLGMTACEPTHLTIEQRVRTLYTTIKYFPVMPWLREIKSYQNYKRISVKVGDFRSECVTLRANFRRKGRRPWAAPP